jgi:hypothetical protein
MQDTYNFLSLSGYISIYMYSRFEDTYTHTYITHICICTGILKIDIHLQTEKEVHENATGCRKHVYIYMYTYSHYDIIGNYNFCRQQKCTNASLKQRKNDVPLGLQSLKVATKQTEKQLEQQFSANPWMKGKHGHSKQANLFFTELHEIVETNASTARMRKQMQTRRKEERYCQKQEVS